LSRMSRRNPPAVSPRPGGEAHPTNTPRSIRTLATRGMFMGATSRLRPRLLFLEEVVKRATGVFRACRPRRGLALQRDTQRKVAARIARAFVGDALRHRLRALKMLAGIEV